MKGTISMKYNAKARTVGYAVGAGVLLFVLLLVAGITTGALPWRDSYAENPWPSNQQDPETPIVSDDPITTATPTPTPDVTPTPTPELPENTPGVILDEELPTYIVTVAFGKGGTAIPYGANTVVENGSIFVVAIPDEGYAVEEMIVDGVNLGSVDTYEFESVTQNHSVYISFTRAQLTPTPTPTPTPEMPASGQDTTNSFAEE